MMTGAETASAPQTGEPSKRQIFSCLLQLHAAVDLFIDHKDPELRLGGAWIADGYCFSQLRYGLKLPIPIEDLSVNNVGLSATLRFGAKNYPTFVPWTAVFAIVPRAASIFGGPKEGPLSTFFPAGLSERILRTLPADHKSWLLAQLDGPVTASWGHLPAPVIDLLTSGPCWPENDQVLLTEADVHGVSSAAAELLLRIDKAMRAGAAGQAWGRYRQEGRTTQEQGVEKRMIESLYHKRLVDSSSPGVALAHELSPGARRTLEALAAREQSRREAAAREAALRAVSKDERGGYAAALGLKHTATPAQIVEAIVRLKVRSSGGKS